MREAWQEMVLHTYGCTNGNEYEVCNELLITLNSRFVHFSDKSSNIKVFSNSHTFSYEKFLRYLLIFNKVWLCVRSKEANEISQDFYEVTGKNINVIIIPYFEGPWSFVRVYCALRRKLKQIVYEQKDKAIIVRLPCPIGFSVINILKNRKPYGVEVIGDPWDVFSPGGVRHVLRPILRQYFTYKLKKSCKNAAGALYVTQEALQKRYPCRNQMFGVSDVALKADDFINESRKFGKKPSYTLIFVGTLNQLYKAPDVLIRAVAKCIKDGINIKLEILGDGKHRQSLVKLAKKLGILERVEFKGIVTKERVIQSLDNADLFVLPSRQEGLPRAMIEAMARGLPCIGSNVGGIPELLNNEDIIPKNDVGALANKIKEVLCNPRRMEEMSKRNIEKANEYREDILQEKRKEFYMYIRKRTEEWLNMRKEM